MEIYDDILQTLGNTPLVRLGRYFAGPATLAAKLEWFNPGNSVKDRIGLALIEAGEREGKLKPGGTIVEPTSGNTGVGLAMAANLRGYKLVCTAADKIPAEKVALLRAYGAEVISPVFQHRQELERRFIAVLDPQELLVAYAIGAIDQ